MSIASIQSRLNLPVNNSGLVIFRVLFGLLIFLESIGAIFTGWVNETFVEPQFTFTFIGFEWLGFLPGPGMYAYYSVMGAFGLLVMIGFRYRWSLGMFTLMWTLSYWLQKSNYNNHYYLLILLCFLMLLVPANGRLSIDAQRSDGIYSRYCPAWCIYVFVLQLWIVYTYAGIAKINPDWLAAKPIDLWFEGKKSYFLVGPLLAMGWFQSLIAIGGMLFDLLHIPFLIWRRSRMAVFLVGVAFHLFNSMIFQIGIFPYLMIAMYLFFFDPDRIEQLFLKSRSVESRPSSPTAGSLPAGIGLVLIIYFLIQLLMPLRHHMFPGDVNWTEEGHRMSWRMMLRTKSGSNQFTVVNPESGERIRIDSRSYLTRNQRSAMIGKPDMIWQFAQRLDQEYSDVFGTNAAVYVQSTAGLNGRKRKLFINPETDLSTVSWDPFRHSDWILDMEE